MKESDILTISISHVSIQYGLNMVLHDVSTVIQPGEIVALIGPNGAGKSTLIKALSGVIPIASGSLFIDGLDLQRLHPAKRAKLVAVIPQARNLPPAYTVRDVVSMGRTAYVGWLGKMNHIDEGIIQEAMERTHITDLSERRMGELSGGEQQRVLVARAITQKPRVMLLDEPTTHLDIQFQLSLMDLITRIAREDKMTVLMVLHDLNLVLKYADRVLLMVNGTLIADGGKADVLNNQLLSKAYQVPMTVTTTATGAAVITAGEFS